MKVVMRMEDGLIFITLFPGRIILRAYITRVLLVMIIVTAKRAKMLRIMISISDILFLTMILDLV